MHDGIHALVFILLCTESSNVFAFHPYELRGTNPAQCVPCNASSYCSAGVRYPCPLNSLAIEYADQLQECICNPGYLGVGEGPPAQIPAELVYDFTSDFNPDPWVWTASYYERVAIWLNYAASIGATTNLNFIGTREGNPDGFGYSALYTTNWTPNGREKEFFELPLPSQYTHMKIIYRINADYGATLGLYINGVLKQTCQDTRNLPPCEYETSYTGSTLLKLLVSQELMVGENLQFFFTQPKPPYSCELGLAPDWYLYGQRNTCPATKGVAANGSGSVEDCVCLPGYASQGSGVYTACLPCPAGTYTKGSNSSECQPCAAGSFQASTGKQVCETCPMNYYSDDVRAIVCTSCPQFSSSARGSQSRASCICNAGYELFNASDGASACRACLPGTYLRNGTCVHCDENTFTDVKASTTCKSCLAQTATYNYPRIGCQCDKGHKCAQQFNFLSVKQVSDGLEDNVNVADHYWNQKFFQLPGVLDTLNLIADNALPERGFEQFNAFSTTYWNVSFPFIKTTDPRTWMRFLDPIKRVTPYHLLPAGTYVGDHPYWGRACHQCESWNYYYGPQDDCYGWESRCGPRVEVPQGLPEAGTCGCGLEWNWKVRTCCEWRPGMHILLDPTDCGPCDTPWNCRCYNGGVQREQGGGNMLPAGDWPSEGVAGKLSQALPFCKYDSDGSILDQFCQTSQTSITVFIFKFYTVLETNSRWIWFVCRKQWTPNFLKCYEFDGNIANVGSYTPAPWNIKRLSAEFSDSCPTACDVCGNNTFKDYTGNLPLGEKDCTKCDVNARSPTGSVLATACLCNSGFHDNGNHTCQACAAGTYKGAGTDHEHDLEPCQQCPVFTSSNERSAKIEDCVCVPGFEGPEFLPAQGGPCVACELGKYKAINGSSSCLNCSIHTWGDETNMTACKSCQDFLRSPGGATESVGAISSDSCFCRPGYITNGTSCSPCAPAHYSLTKNLPECTQCPQHTYTDPALFPWDLTTDCRVCKLCNTLTNTAFTDHYDEARGGVGCGESSVEVCTQCPVRSSLFLQTTDSNRNFGVQSCVCDENSYGIIGSECTLCPVGQNRTGFIYANTTLQNCECLPGYEPDPALPQQCRKCLVDTYKALGGDGNCTSCPAGFVTDGRTAQTYCVCAMGTEQLDTTSEEPVCETCREGRFKNASTDKYANLQCLNCSKICRKCKQKLIDFSPYTVGQGWKDYAVANGFTSSSLFWWATSMHDQSWNAIGNSPGVGYMTYPGLPAEYSTVQVQFAARNIESGQTVYLEIGGSLVATAQNYQTITHKQKYTPGQSLKIVEHGLPGGIAQELKIWLSSCDVVYDSVQSEVELYVIEECHNSSDVICKACQTCQRGSYDNNTCGEKYGNNRLDTQCLPCPDGFYCPGAKSPPFMCTQRVCPANQQVQTLCSGSQDIVCKACQTNSWSNAGRTELGPCLCNAGYELQGELCVACAVGKARQANNSNSIVCETCNSTTFTSVSGTISCRACSPICQDIDTPPPGIFNPPELSRRYSEVSQYHSPGSGNARSMLDSEAGWLNDATYRHMTMDLGKFILVAGVVIQAHKTQNKYVTQVEVQYTDLASPTISCSSQCHVVPSQWIPIKSESGSLRFFPKSTFYNQEKSILLFQTPVITKYIKITVHEQIGGCAMRAGVLIDTMRLFLKHECNASRNVICQDCQKCRPGFYANNTCGANYGNDRLDTECVSCPENYFCPGTPTLQQPLLCSEQLCTANQQVATLCNTTHNITCKACQANSWSYAGRTLLDPCFCNAGYELQGELCVACPVGKARQANANNSIVCETCAVGTFTSVSATVSCGACSAMCSLLTKSIIYDFAPYTDLGSWNNYATSIGATTQLNHFMFGGVFMNHDNVGWFNLPLPSEYNIVQVDFYTPWSYGFVVLQIDGVDKAQTTSPSTGPTTIYTQNYVPGQILRLYETGGVIGSALKITLSKFGDTYVRHECNASRDVICQECQTCGPGFYANNTCGANYSNDRLDTQCSACPENYFCPGTPTLQQPVLCSEQRCVANQQVATLCNTTHNITCKACQPNSWSYAGRTLLDPCFCNAGYELQGELCVACPVGKARQANANNSIVCETCAVGTFTSVSASITCQFCANDCPDIPFSTHALADFRGIATEVQKNTVGNIPYYDANWNMPGAKKKWADYALSKGVGYFGFTGEGGGGFWGAHLFVEFTLPANYNWFYLTVPHPNVIKVENSAGIGLRVMINDIDVHKCMPPGCDYKRQYTPLQKLKVLATGGVLGYDLVLSVYSSTTGNMATENLYVRQECNASRDVICEKCQTCGPGFYDNNTCGANYGNDRIDTQCVPCQAGSYCPTGTGPPILCPDNGKSPAGSDDLKDCDCDPGYFRDLDGCSLCHFDYYCPGKQIQYSIACPPDSRTARRGSTSRLDCHCHTGYFRDPPESLDSFNCSLCLPGDFCFNNSAYNCSDALMVSAPGSGFFDNCTCDSGYYNNGTVCEDCPINYYCEGGKRFSCLANEWTAYEGRSYECVCMPGFYRDNDVCVPCTDDYFCEGRDDSRQACPQHSTGREASDIQHCLCNSGFEVIANANASEPHTCRACEHTDGAYKYKTGLGNRACSVCTECSPGSHSTWTQIACTPTLNALCDFCTTCHNATENPIRLLYTEQHCQQFFDTRCANCSVCDWDTEWEFSPCSEMDDSQCSPITRDRACPIGFYVGGHTRSSDSQCIPCAVRNTQYEGEWLHHFTSMGRSYGDPYSCDLTCRAFSRLTNVSDPSHGCSTCETGNVLLKEFTQNPLACEFECLPGYTKHGGDCELQTFYADPLIYWNHSLNVTHVRRQAMSNSSGRSAFQLTVGHTAHGNFAVVVGRSEPTCAGRAAVVLRAHSRTACCFSQLWRISTLNQLGLSSTTREQCSRSNPPWSERVSNTQLVFEVSDARIEELANCSRFEDGLVCELYVSIVDTLLLHHFSVPVRLELRRAAALSAVSTQTYVPLSGLHVEAQLAYVELDGSPIFVVVSDMAPLPGAGETDVVLHSAGLRLVQPPPEANCERYGTRVGSSLASDSLSLHNVSAEAWTLAGTPLRAVTFLRAPQGTQFLKLLYSLRLRERDGTIGTKNMMQVAVWRNLSQVRPVCDLPPPLLTVEDGEVFSCSGLGKTTVFAATALHRPTETVRGEVGGLTSFVARALHPHIASIAIKQMLVAFALPAAAERVTAVNVTSMHLGNLAFTDEFKTACQATELCHFRHVHQGRGMHLLNNCNATARESARAWLRINLGFVEDDGHVEALCGLAHRQSARKYAFLVVLVNTRAYLPRGALWHDLQNHSAPQSTSRVAALFEFL